MVYQMPKFLHTNGILTHKNQQQKLCINQQWSILLQIHPIWEFIQPRIPAEVGPESIKYHP